MPDSLRDQIQTSLGTAYTLERELGGGGMSRVFLARETALDRDIVVKVLSPELAAGVSAERFTREIKLAASLQQANIVPLLAAGETDGLPYYTMPFVDGLSLRARLERNGALPTGEAISVLRDVARALAYAHEHGVVHRDVKPENILLSGDAAVVTDFGIAKALSASRTNAPGGTLTQVGTSIGTPAYMAPEQAAGDPATDHRADIYALGCVAYEMLTGASPFAGRPVHQLFAAHLNETPVPVEKSRPDAPRALAQLVARCLEKDPARRPPSARAVLDALAAAGDGAAHRPSTAPPRRRAAVAVAALLVAAVAVIAWRALRERSAPSPDATDVHRIAVLPFQNLGDSADAYFADGITDAVRGKLTSIPRLGVIARASSMSYRSTTKSPEAIANELHVRYLLTGTVRFAGTGADRRVQVSPELVQVADGRPAESRWQQPFDASVKDVFGVQADIAGRVASALDLALGDSARRALAAAPTSNLAAYDAYLKGEAASLALGASDPPTLRRAISFYEQAVALDPRFAAAWSRLAATYSVLYANSTPTPQLAEKAREATERIEALAPGRAEAALATGAYSRLVLHDSKRSLATLEAAIRTAPNDAALSSSLSASAAAAGQWEAGLGYARRAWSLDPRSVRAAQRVVLMLAAMRKFSEAQAAADSALALAPTNLAVIEYRAMVPLAQGDLAGARAVIRRLSAGVDRSALIAYLGNYRDLYWVLDDADQRALLALPPSAFDDDRTVWAIVRAQTYDLRGDSVRARAYADSARIAIEEQIRLTPNDDQRHLFHGLALAYLGRKAEAIAEGERSVVMMSTSKDAVSGAYNEHVLARIYAMFGEREKAIAMLRDVLAAPYPLTGAWLRIDPGFASLRGDPRFEALVAGH